MPIIKDNSINTDTLAESDLSGVYWLSVVAWEFFFKCQHKNPLTTLK